MVDILAKIESFRKSHPFVFSGGFSNLLSSIARNPIKLLPTNFIPAEKTPWGGHRIKEFKGELGLAFGEEVIGESWEISGHKNQISSFKIFHEGSEYTLPITLLAEAFPEDFLGSSVVEKHGTKIPFLVKFINSGSWKMHHSELSRVLESLNNESVAGDLKKLLNIASFSDISSRDNHFIHHSLSKIKDKTKNKEISELHAKLLTNNLSFQVHPSPEYKPGVESKTECWYIIDAEEGAGIYLGLKEGVNKENFEETITNKKDPTALLNFIQPKTGDVFYIPAGTPHAIGAGILLFELQETSDTTYRFYDYNRTDKTGKKRELHIEDSLNSINWDAKRGDQLINELRRKSTEEALLQEKEFELYKISLTDDESHIGNTDERIQSITVLSGKVIIRSETNPTTYISATKGESLILPSGFGKYKAKSISYGRKAVYLLSTAPR